MVSLNKVNKFVKNIMRVVDTTPQLVGYKTDIKTFCSMLTDCAKGEYKHISKRTGVIIGICIAYILCPVDLIPDFIPVAGQIDDVAVIVFLLKTVKKELGFYRIWLAARDSDVIDVG